LEEHPRGLDLGQVLGAGFVILYLWMIAVECAYVFGWGHGLCVKRLNDFEGDLGAVMEAHLLLDLMRAFQIGLPMISDDLAVIDACPCSCSAPHIFCLLPRLYTFYDPFPASSSYPASCPPFPSIGFGLSSCLLISIDACSHYAHDAGLYPRAYLARCWCRL
jgi:hypothetical protein